MDCRQLPGDPSTLHAFNWDNVFPKKRRAPWFRVWIVLACLGLAPTLWRVWRLPPEDANATLAKGLTDAEVWRQRYTVLARASEGHATPALTVMLRRIDGMARTLPAEEADALLFWKTYAVLYAGGVPRDVPDACHNTKRLLGQ